MYSVLIQNQKTMDSFSQFHPVFMDALNSGKVGVCQWLEAGTTIETAVPELYNMINDKEEWRAVIVRIGDDCGVESYPSSPENPFDFIVNQSGDIGVHESPIPLVRLTQMLGGVPAPILHFEPETVEEFGKAPRVIYSPRINEEDEAEFRKLSEKYRFNGRPPSEIILISTRKKLDPRGKSLKKAWSHNREIDSSEFWKRNGYPSSCRFAVFDMEQQGPIQENADNFSLWTAVMLLAANEIDPSTLQAYKLHHVSVEFNRETMRAVMQTTAIRALSARKCIEGSIQRELEQKLNEGVVLPNYRLKVPVMLDLPKKKDFHADGDTFKLTARRSYGEIETWSGMVENARKGISELNVCAERALDKSADRMKHYCGYSERDIFPLDKYQTEDLGKELSADHDSIFDARSELPCNDAKDQEKFHNLSAAVRKKLLKRVSTSQAVWICVLAAAAFLLSLIPALLFCRNRGWGTYQGIALTALAGIFVLSLTEIAVLLVRRLLLLTKIREFNGFVSGVVTRIAENSNTFSDYMSNIASFMHGSSFMSLIHRNRFLRNEEQYHKQNHMAALDSYVAKLKQWCEAFHLTVFFEAAEVVDEISVNTEVAPYVNPMYTFETDITYSIPVNNTGDTVEAPFSFIERLRITREELYDDAG